MDTTHKPLLDQFTPSQLNRLRLAPTLEEKETLILQFKQQNQAQAAIEIQQGLDELKQQIANIRRPTSRFGLAAENGAIRLRPVELPAQQPMDSAQRKRFIAQLDGTEVSNELDD